MKFIYFLGNYLEIIDILLKEEYEVELKKVVMKFIKILLNWEV